MADAPPSRAAVVADGVGKTYRVPQERMHTLKERALHPFRRTRHDPLEALRDVSFSVEPGEFFGIVGRNGSGKSTLLKCLAGIYRADHGAIYVNGRLSTFIELGVGFNPDLAARDNVILNAIMLGLPPKEARERVDGVIEFAELQEFEDLKLKNYSSGMHVRLAFSVMIQVDADILLIDEVLAVGDAAFQQKCFDEFRRLREEGRTILLVTHDMSAVHRFCDRAMLLERGEVIATGDPDEVAEQYLALNFPRGRTERTVLEDEEQGLALAARIAEVWFEDENGFPQEFLAHGRRCTFRAKVGFAADVPNARFELEMTNEDGVLVFQTSAAGGAFTAGDTAEFTVEIADNKLAPGWRYQATPRVLAEPGEPPLDEREGAVSIVVTGARVAGKELDLEHEARVERAAPGTRAGA
ncbi:MAG TPA: ABC transporter ATP-binding protein [Thermoleophilaceae bacterium]|nr:ABC transporter ATP-binding protein [Thermoleophilaceae bacterium]